MSIKENGQDSDDWSEGSWETDEETEESLYEDINPASSLMQEKAALDEQAQYLSNSLQKSVSPSVPTLSQVLKDLPTPPPIPTHSKQTVTETPKVPAKPEKIRKIDLHRTVPPPVPHVKGKTSQTSSGSPAASLSTSPATSLSSLHRAVDGSGSGYIPPIPPSRKNTAKKQENVSFSFISFHNYKEIRQICRHKLIVLLCMYKLCNFGL